MRYFVLDDAGNQYGPADLLTLQQWVTEGRVLAATKLKEEMSGTVVPAGEVTGLTFPSAAPTMSAPTTGAVKQDYSQNPYESGPRPQQFAEYHRGGPVGTPVDTTPALIKSILATLCCCLPLGIASIVFAVQAQSANGVQDYVKAKEARDKANTFANIAIILGLIGNGIYFVVMIIGAMNGGLK